MKGDATVGFRGGIALEMPHGFKGIDSEERRGDGDGGDDGGVGMATVRVEQRR